MYILLTVCLIVTCLILLKKRWVTLFCIFSTINNWTRREVTKKKRTATSLEVDDAKDDDTHDGDEDDHDGTAERNLDVEAAEGQETPKGKLAGFKAFFGRQKHSAKRNLRRLHRRRSSPPPDIPLDTLQALNDLLEKEKETDLDEEDNTILETHAEVHAERRDSASSSSSGIFPVGHKTDKVPVTSPRVEEMPSPITPTEKDDAVSGGEDAFSTPLRNVNKKEKETKKKTTTCLRSGHAY